MTSISELIYSKQKLILLNMYYCINSILLLVYDFIVRYYFVITIYMLLIKMFRLL